MAKPFHLAGAAVMVLVLCSAAMAQRGGFGGRAGGHFTASRSSSSSFTRSLSSSRFSTAYRNVQIQPSTRSFSYGYTPAGLPFYYPNLPPLNGNFGAHHPGVGARGGFGRNGRGAFVPIIWGGIPYYYDCLDTYINCLDEAGDQSAYAAAVTQAPAPQVVIVQEPIAVAPSTASGDPNAVAAPPPAASDAAAAPAQDDTGFVLIRRDGQVLFATAYSVVGPNIRYVTPEGLIRTIPLSELDMDSTRSMNEARGVALFPN